MGGRKCELSEHMYFQTFLPELHHNMAHTIFHKPDKCVKSKLMTRHASGAKLTRQCKQEVVHSTPAKAEAAALTVPASPCRPILKLKTLGGGGGEGEIHVSVEFVYSDCRLMMMELITPHHILGINKRCHQHPP